MDVDVAALQRFAEVPAIVESARSSKAGLVEAAAVVLAKGGLKMQVPEGKGIPNERYRGIVEGIRKQIATDLAANGYRIEVFDSSQPNLAKEATRASAMLKGDGAGVVAQSRKMGAFAVGLREGQGKAACLVVGFTPKTDVDVMFRVAADLPVKRQGMDDEQVHRMVLWHEMGHCVLGNDEGKADTFSFLMALRHTDVSKDALSMWATAREIAEWSSPDPKDDHFMAKALWHVIARADALRADPEFMAMDALGVAALAKTMWEERGYTPAELEHMVAVRKGLQTVQNAKAHFIPTSRGLARTDMQGWVSINSDIPEIGRMLELSVNLIEGAKPMAPFEQSPEYTKAAFKELAAAGDPSARSMLRALATEGKGAPVGRHDAAHSLGVSIPYKLDRIAYHDRVISFDPSCQAVFFSPDQARFAVREASSGHVVSSGDVVLGDARTEAVHRIREAMGMDEREHAAPRGKAFDLRGAMPDAPAFEGDEPEPRSFGMR